MGDGIGIAVGMFINLLISLSYMEKTCLFAFLAIMILTIFLISGCAKTPIAKEHLPSCDDTNPCTKDYCSNETAFECIQEGFRCIHEGITPCCGNKQCELGENYRNCLSDCPNPKIALKEPSELALQISDISSNYTVKERTERVKSDVSSEGINLGWEKGYYARYARIGETLLEATVIEQIVSIYPIENASKVLSLPQESTEDLIFVRLSRPNIGDHSRAFRIIEIDELGKEHRYYIIEFVKMNVYESFYMTGTTTDYEFLKELARKAEKKIN